MTAIISDFPFFREREEHKKYADQEEEIDKLKKGNRKMLFEDKARDNLESQAHSRRAT